MSPTSPPEASRTSIVEVPPGRRGAYLPLLRLADDSAEQIESYRERGVLFGLVEPSTSSPVGLVLTDEFEAADTVRLWSVAIAEARQGRGLGRRMVCEVLERLRRRGARRAVVSTASSSVGVLAFYQRLGFRMLRIERDAFGPDRGYPPDLMEDGIPVRDRVWLDRAL